MWLWWWWWCIPWSNVICICCGYLTHTNRLKWLCHLNGWSRFKIIIFFNFYFPDLFTQRMIYLRKFIVLCLMGWIFIYGRCTYRCNQYKHTFSVMLSKKFSWIIGLDIFFITRLCFFITNAEMWLCGLCSLQTQFTFCTLIQWYAVLTL